MREILFRGKRDDGEWVEGYFVHCKSIYDDETGRTAEIIPHNADRIYDGEYSPYDVHKVILETVGQFTGLTENGKRIFEGDIVKAFFRNNHSKQIFRVVFDDGIFLFDNNCVKVPKYDIYAMEVIGNIHDNPELLEANK